MEPKQMREFIKVSAIREPLFDNGGFLSLPNRVLKILDVLEHGSTLLR